MPYRLPIIAYYPPIPPTIILQGQGGGRHRRGDRADHRRPEGGRGVRGRLLQRRVLRRGVPGTNCIKLGLPGKLILRDYFQGDYDFPKTFSLTEIQFSGKTYFYTIAPRSCARDSSPSTTRSQTSASISCRGAIQWKKYWLEF